MFSNIYSLLIFILVMLYKLDVLFLIHCWISTGLKELSNRGCLTMYFIINDPNYCHFSDGVNFLYSCLNILGIKVHCRYLILISRRKRGIKNIIKLTTIKTSQPINNMSSWFCKVYNVNYVFLHFKCIIHFKLNNGNYGTDADINIDYFQLASHM